MYVQVEGDADLPGVINFLSVYVGLVQRSRDIGSGGDSLGVIVAWRVLSVKDCRDSLMASMDGLTRLIFAHAQPLGN